MLLPATLKSAVPTDLFILLAGAVVTGYQR